jgi:acyl-CoA reductase-like NAD-dependent aldehyde dehydrogenase
VAARCVIVFSFRASGPGAKTRGMDPKTLADAAKRFLSESIDTRGGRDPIAALYGERRAAYSLFSLQLSDAACEALRPYLFGRPIPRKAGDAPVTCLNLVDGEWRRPAEVVPMKSLADRRVTLHEIARTREADVEHCIDRAWSYWQSLDWASEGQAYRKWVIKNFSRLLHYYYEECLDELRQQTPKTRLEADKDFWEAKRAADHLEGNLEKACQGSIIPLMVPGQTYWKDAYLPAGVCAVITPMNFIYGIPGIQIVGCYLSGSPMIFKGHPFSAITSTTLIKMLIAAGADPRTVHKLEGFGGDIAKLTSDERIAVVSVTGSAETAKNIQRGRGVRPVRFEGGGCNWAWIDDGYSDAELGKIAARLAYSKLGMGSHKCTSLHGVSASKATLDRFEPLLAKELAEFKVIDPRHTTETKVVSPCMVHKASTVTSIQEAARKAGHKILLEGGKRETSDYEKHTEAAAPVMIGRVKPGSLIEVDWDGKSTKIDLATTEFFMPVLVTMETASFDDFVRFSIMVNPHDLAVSIWTRDDAKIQRGRRTLGGMLKENDGTDSALEWEEFGASGVGESGNTGVGDAETTLAMFSRRQKGRHLSF